MSDGHMLHDRLILLGTRNGGTLIICMCRCVKGRFTHSRPLLLANRNLLGYQCHNVDNNGNELITPFYTAVEVEDIEIES
jgi:hypothetical protein